MILNHILVGFDVQESSTLVDKGNQRTIKYEPRDTINPKLVDLYTQYKGMKRKHSEKDLKRKHITHPCLEFLLLISRGNGKTRPNCCVAWILKTQENQESLNNTLK